MSIPLSLTSEETAGFLSRVDRSGGGDACWPWTGSRFRQGYGQFHIHGCNPVKAHRVAYFVSAGQDPGDLCVCHRCDNPPCCNPAHLFLGTIADNNADRDSKGRTVYPNVGRVFGPEFRAKLSAAMRGKPSYQRTPEIRARASAIRRAWHLAHPGVQKKPPKPCVNCGVPSKPLWRGRCHACDIYFRRRGIERPVATCEAALASGARRSTAP